MATTTLRFRYGNVTDPAPAGSARLFLTPEKVLKFIDQEGTVFDVGPVDTGGGGTEAVSVVTNSELYMLGPDDLTLGGIVRVAGSPMIVEIGCDPVSAFIDSLVNIGTLNLDENGTTFDLIYNVGGTDTESGQINVATGDDAETVAAKTADLINSHLALNAHAVASGNVCEVTMLRNGTFEYPLYNNIGFSLTVTQNGDFPQGDYWVVNPAKAGTGAAFSRIVSADSLVGKGFLGYVDSNGSSYSIQSIPPATQSPFEMIELPVADGAELYAGELDYPSGITVTRAGQLFIEAGLMFLTPPPNTFSSGSIWKNGVVAAEIGRGFTPPLDDSSASYTHTPVADYLHGIYRGSTILNVEKGDLIQLMGYQDGSEALFVYSNGALSFIRGTWLS